MEVQTKYSQDDLETMLGVLSHVSEEGLESPVIFPKLFELGGTSWAVVTGHLVEV